MSDSGEEITVDNHTNVQKPKDTNEFSAVDAVCLFNTKIDIVLDKQRSSIVSELQEKLQVNTDIKGEGIKIQFSFNQERLSNLDRLKNYLSRGSVEEVFELIESEKKALTHLRMPPSYRQPSLEPPRRGRLPMPEINPHNHLFSVLDQEFSTACLITSFFSVLKTTVSAKSSIQDHNFKTTDKTSLLEQTLPATSVICQGISPSSCPYTAQLQSRQPAAATVTNPEPFNKQQ
ncbi:Hypothetical predicted protein [Mytilus galloprovincialis]|uniref:Uncharacterized protein n=1 Tax=Mytilus galloprovincialis TaxID=29158 RepID=A0A8B6GTG8_MYTGA|nr:Hypothetical predicted protein [Mytilus galloprovincialis]